MDADHCKEDLSVSYVRAVSTSIGVTCEELKRDINGCDVLVRSQDTPTATSAQLSIQLKCTVNRLRRVDGGRAVAFQVPADDYEQLRRAPAQPPRILVVVEVPAEEQYSWFDISPAAIVLKAAAWYTSLAGAAPLPPGQGSKTVQIPVAQRFNAAALHANMRSPL